MKINQSDTDLEKAASGASGACGHFDRNHAILTTFWVKLSKDRGRRGNNEELRLDKGDLR